MKNGHLTSFIFNDTEKQESCKNEILNLNDFLFELFKEDFESRQIKRLHPVEGDDCFTLRQPSSIKP